MPSFICIYYSAKRAAPQAEKSLRRCGTYYEAAKGAQGIACAPLWFCNFIFMCSVGKQRRGEVPVAGVGQQDDNRLTLVFRLLPQTATAALCSLSAGSYSGRTGHAERIGSLMCHRLCRQEYRSPSDPKAASAKELPPYNHQHFRQTAKKPQAAGLFQRWHEFSCSDLRVFCRCCLMSDFCSLSYSTTCLHGCFDRR